MAGSKKQNVEEIKIAKAVSEEAVTVLTGEDVADQLNEPLKDTRSPNFPIVFTAGLCPHTLLADESKFKGKAAKYFGDGILGL